MKAIKFEEYGNPAEFLKVVDLFGVDAPAGGKVVIALAVASLAVWDAGAFEGRGIDRSRFGVHRGSGEEPRRDAIAILSVTGAYPALVESCR
jgi:hypothetical protein